MSPAECMRLLGLSEAASAAEIKHAYRVRARQLHPDKHGGREDARRRFIELSEAYRTLMAGIRAARKGRPVGICPTCQGFGELNRGQDGRLRCPRCALAPRARFLPLPVYIAASLAAPAILLAIGAGLLWKAIEREDLHLSVYAFMMAVLSMAVLAVICFRVVHCLPSSDASRRRPPGLL